MIQSLQDSVELANGTKIPGFGLGVFQVANQDASEAVKEAITTGYRLIDTAQIYGNEEGTGEGIKKGLKAASLERKDLFVTSKVWNNHLSYEDTIQALNESLEKLGLDYLDLYLIHWPGKDAFRTSYKALEDLYRQGKIKAIGVSNFQKHHLEELLNFATIKPVLNQIELHPKLIQKELRAFCKERDIRIQAWSPLMQGQILSDPVLENIAQTHQRSVAQIVLRWDIQQDILVVSKSAKPERIKSNAQLFDFELTQEELSQITALNENLRVGPDPDQFDFV
ncbi:aldo/keto reductase [Listeria valentina]|uniref:aldo/keto reductase n=1 Tax=Listeria valentina TaxID=2705293 RepID=UPI0014314B1B|nr:aldo/keto reductase [Listeria valentina]